MRKISMVLPLLFVVACEVGPEYIRPKIDMPDLKSNKPSLFISEKWWMIFNDDVLNQLEDRALIHNADLKQAIDNIAIAQAEADISLGDLFPSFVATGSGSKNRMSSTSQNYIPNFTKSRNTRSYAAGLSTSYELDLFGKYRSANESAKAKLLASAATKQVVALTVTSEVAKTFFLIRALEAKLLIANRTLKTRQKTYEVYESRYKNGYCTQLDFMRVKAELYSVKTTVLSLEETLSKAETAMCVLIGCSPREMIGWKLQSSKPLDFLKISSEVPHDIPSDILARRPDVLAAEGQLMSANAEIGKTVAANFPSISLTGSLGYESKKLTDVFRPISDTVGLSIGINLPIFNGGKIAAATRAAKASYRVQLAEYYKAVQNAFKESLDSLMSYHRDSEIVESRLHQVEALKKSYALACKQKDAGLIGLLDLLDVERGLLAAEIDLVEATKVKLDSIVGVCKAFGGGWTEICVKKDLDK